jgi:tripartite-type tricarboxylate transporter receptor subunit TctC
MTLQNMGTILPVVRDGRLRGLAVTSLKRTPIMPDLPSIAESGFPGFEATSWFGLLAPARTPAPVIAKAQQQAAAVAALPDVREKLTQLGLDTTADGPGAFSAIIKADTAKWAKVIKDADIKVGP